MIIRDPSNSNGVRVSEDGGLLTFSNVARLEHYEAHKRGNVFHITHTVTAPSSGFNTIFLFKSIDTDTNYSILISNIIVSCDSNAQWNIYTGTERTSGGGSLTPINSNTGSSNNINATIYGSNIGDFIIETGQQYAVYKTMSRSYEAFEIIGADSLLLYYNKSIGISCKTSIGATIYVSLILTRHLKEL